MKDHIIETVIFYDTTMHWAITTCKSTEIPALWVQLLHNFYLEAA